MDGSINTFFRSKIDEKIYCFDIVVVHLSMYSSFVVGYCLVNTKKDTTYAVISGSYEEDEDIQKKLQRLKEDALKQAKQFEFIFE